MSRGGKNLILLGTISIVLAVITTAVSLIVYHNSGDIYLDRSRPGFLPDEEERKEPEDPDYTLPETGVITKEVLNTYINSLKLEAERLDQISEPFSDGPLSDESLGISEN